MTRTAYINATIWTGTGEVIDRGGLVTQDGRIVQVGSNIDMSGSEIVDCAGQYLLPGFIDAHAHTGIWGEGSHDDFDGNEMSEAITPYVRALDSIYPEDPGFDDARRGGVTTIGIMHGSANPIGGQLTVAKSAGLVADDMVLREPAGVKMAFGENPKRVGESRKRAPTSRMGVAHLARKSFVEAQEYQKDWEHHEALVAAEAAKPESERTPLRSPKRDLGLEILVKVLNRELPIRNHAHRMDDIRTAIRLSEEFGYELILDHATEAHRIIDEIVSRNIPVCLGPLIGGRSKREVARKTPASVGIMVKAGAKVIVMTDSPFVPVEHLRDQVIIAIREGLPEDRALETITSNPADILGVADRVGTLEVGKDADFILMKGDPWDARTRVQQTFINGQLVFSADGPYIPD